MWIVERQVQYNSNVEFQSKFLCKTFVMRACEVI